MRQACQEGGSARRSGQRAVTLLQPPRTCTQRAKSVQVLGRRGLARYSQSGRAPALPQPQRATFVCPRRPYRARGLLLWELDRPRLTRQRSRQVLRQQLSRQCRRCCTSDSLLDDRCSCRDWAVIGRRVRLIGCRCRATACGPVYETANATAGRAVQCLYGGQCCSVSVRRASFT